MHFKFTILQICSKKFHLIIMLSCPKANSDISTFLQLRHYHLVSTNVFILLLLFDFDQLGLKALWLYDGSSWQLSEGQPKYFITDISCNSVNCVYSNILNIERVHVLRSYRFWLWSKARKALNDMVAHGNKRLALLLYYWYFLLFNNHVHSLQYILNIVRIHNIKANVVSFMISLNSQVML